MAPPAGVLLLAAAVLAAFLPAASAHGWVTIRNQSGARIESRNSATWKRGGRYPNPHGYVNVGSASRPPYCGGRGDAGRGEDHDSVSAAAALRQARDQNFPTVLHKGSKFTLENWILTNHGGVAALYYSCPSDDVMTAEGYAGLDWKLLMPIRDSFPESKRNGVGFSDKMPGWFGFTGQVCEGVFPGYDLSGIIRECDDCQVRHGSPELAAEWNSQRGGSGAGSHSGSIKVEMEYELPADFECTHAVFSWIWDAAQKCRPKYVQEAGAEQDFWGSCGLKQGIGGEVCSSLWQGEVYTNCIDAEIVGAGVVSTTTTTIATTTEATRATSATSTTSGSGSATGSAGVVDCTSCFTSYGDKACLTTSGSCFPAAQGVCRELDFQYCGNGAATTTETHTTTSTTVATTTALVPDHFAGVDGGKDRVCRGAHSGDNDPSYYKVEGGTSSLEACKHHCRRTSGCVGIEYSSSSSRCEIWIRPEGIGASRQIPGYQCYKYIASMGTTTTSTTIMVGEFTEVDTGSNRACRGADNVDNNPNYYTVRGGTPSLGACKNHCQVTDGCVGIEYNSDSFRCEVWTRPEGIGASRQVPGYTCLRFAPATARCRASATSPGSGASDALCAETCSLLSDNTWPCSSGGPCDCSTIDAAQISSEIKPHRNLRARGNALLQVSSCANQSCISQCKGKRTGKVDLEL